MFGKITKFRKRESAENMLKLCPSNYMIYDGNGDKKGEYFLVGTSVEKITDKPMYI